MLKMGVAIFLGLAAMTADPIETSRKTYTNCLREFHNTSVTDKLSISDFRDKVKLACETERGNYQSTLVRSERSFGASVKEAEAYAAEEIQIVIDVISTAFADNASEGAKLLPEK
jgi:hypothetical protein